MLTLLDRNNRVGRVTHSLCCCVHVWNVTVHRQPAAPLVCLQRTAARAADDTLQDSQHARRGFQVMGAQV